MTISGAEVHRILRHRYPNATVYVLDEWYTVPEKSEVQTLYTKFQRALKIHRLLKWVTDVFDCDNFAWNFKGATNAHKAATGADKEYPIGFLCYMIHGDKNQPHAINNAIWRDGNGNLIREIEPQPRGGIKSLSKRERESAWLVIV